jgi:hypothetical protein
MKDFCPQKRTLLALLINQCGIFISIEKSNQSLSCCYSYSRAQSVVCRGSKFIWVTVNAGGLCSLRVYYACRTIITLPFPMHTLRVHLNRPLETALVHLIIYTKEPCSIQ